MSVKLFTVPGIPTSQGRPRFARIGNFVRTYDPAKSSNWKQTVAQWATAAGIKPTSQPVILGVDVFVPRPKTLCRKKDAPEAIRCTKRPDCDNYAKLIADALIGVAYADDALIWKMVVRKFYHELGGVPRTEVSIETESER